MHKIKTRKSSEKPLSHKETMALWEIRILQDELRTNHGTSATYKSRLLRDDLSSLVWNILDGVEKNPGPRINRIRHELNYLRLTTPSQ
jgi:hypothetical protein